MQNFCILLYILFVSTHLKSTLSARIERSQWSLGLRTSPCSESERSERMSHEEEDVDNRFGPCEGDRYSPDSFNSVVKTQKIAAFFDTEHIKNLLNIWYFRRAVPQNKLQQERDPHQKRALTMLSRWKPFQLPNTIEENGRQATRSSLTARSDPFSNLQIMGRPFRWG